MAIVRVVLVAIFAMANAAQVKIAGEPGQKVLRSITRRSEFSSVHIFSQVGAVI